MSNEPKKEEEFNHLAFWIKLTIIIILVILFSPTIFGSVMIAMIGFSRLFKLF